MHEVIADVKVGPAISIEVSEQGAQAPVGRWGVKFSAVLVKERALRPGDRSEVASALIEVEKIPFTALQDFSAAIPLAHRDESVFRSDLDGSVGLPSGFHSQTGRLVLEGGAPVIGHVEIQVAVTIDVGQCQGGGSQTLGEPVLRGFGEVSGPIVQEQAGAKPQTVDQQIEVPVTIDVHQDGARAGLVATGCSSGFGLSLESPATPVEVQFVGAIQPCEVEVAPAVSVDIPEGHAGAVFQDAVVGHRGLANRVGHGHAGGIRGHSGESRTMTGGSRQSADAASDHFTPNRCWSTRIGQNSHSKSPAYGEESGKPAHGDLPQALTGLCPRRKAWSPNLGRLSESPVRSPITHPSHPH